MAVENCRADTRRGLDVQRHWLFIAALIATETSQSMKCLAPPGCGLGPALAHLGDPCRFARAADQALAAGERDEALALISQTYVAFDLLWAACRHSCRRVKCCLDAEFSLEEEAYGHFEEG